MQKMWKSLFHYCRSEVEGGGVGWLGVVSALCEYLKRQIIFGGGLGNV